MSSMRWHRARPSMGRRSSKSATTTVLLRLGDRMRTTAFGWLDIEVNRA